MSYIVKGNLADWELVIGLEVHAQIKSKSKLFSSASAEFGGAPNANTSFVDIAFPGSLPSLNKECVKQAIRASLALNGHINKISYFDRKQYFYPDLPFGYQITQFYKPIMEDGYLFISDDSSKEEGAQKKVRIERIHIEQDAGKMMHDQHPSKSFIDLNRAGVGLMEIVSYPDISSPQEASDYVNRLRSILRYVGACDGNMEEGSMRCDVNISVRKVGESKLRERAEIKNVNSLKFIAQAIEYEAERQVKVWEDGGAIKPETRLFDSNKCITIGMREKVGVAGYRYFPDPDLLPLELSDELISEIKSTLPELPDAKRDRFIKNFGLTEYDASVLVVEKEVANYFEESCKGVKNCKAVAGWIVNSLFGALKKSGLAISSSPISPLQISELVNLVDSGEISGKIAKEVFEIMLKERGADPKKIVEDKGLKQISDTSAIEGIVDEIIASNPDKVEQIKSGKDKLRGWFVGQVMAKTQGKANPAMVNEILNKKI